MARLRPRERVVLSAIRREKVIQKKGRHMHKRFRSWSQQRLRQYWLPMKVCLTADASLMDGQYLSACMQKAASVRKHDLQLWYGYCRRFLEVAETMTPQQMAYAFYGLGKSRFLCEQAYRAAVPHILSGLPDYHSHALMAVCWAMSRVQVREPLLMEKIGEAVIARADSMRPSDFIKVCNVLARMGTPATPSIKASLSKLIVDRLETVFAQSFRNAMYDVAVCNLYGDHAKVYIMTRFSKIFICARPQHYQQAFQSAVALRVLYPHVWNALPKQVRCFYIRLSMRRIPQPTRRPSKLHWDVSNILAKLGIAHRNTFQWGCYWIDIGEAEQRRNCWFIDGPSCFYTSTNIYLESKKLQHRVLNDLGWDIRRVRWDDWIRLNNDEAAQMNFIRQMRDAEPMGAVLQDGPSVSANEIKTLLLKVKAHKEFRRLKGISEKKTIHF